MSKIIRIKQNTNGVDYFVGDIHGCYTLLEEALRKVNFNESKDRLFALGDLTDRGPESYLAPEYLRQKWFISVQGNHDAFVYHTARYILKDIAEGDLDEDEDDNDQDIMTCLKEGGKWLLAQPKIVLSSIVDTFKELPLAIEYLNENGTVLAGLLHAELGVDVDWKDLVSLLEDLPVDYVYRLKECEDKPVSVCVWGRTKAQTAKQKDPSLLPEETRNYLRSNGVPLIICGHNVISHDRHNGPFKIENNRLIDHGICRGGGVHLYTFEDLQ